MSEITKVDRSSFDKIYSLLTRSKWTIPRHTWLHLFEPKWETGQSFCGYALFVDRKPVGFISLIFSHRKINGKIMKTCGLSAWFVENQYRSDSLKLLEPILEMTDYVLINLTASPKVYEISKALGFIDFEKYEVFIFPRIDFVSLIRKSRKFITGIEKDITQILNDDDLLIYNDHKHYNYEHMVVDLRERTGDYCYLIYKLVNRKRLPVIRIDYISDKDIFVRYLGQIVFEMFKKRPFLFLIVDSRQVAPHDISFSIKLKLDVPRFCRPDQYGSIPTGDNLYSEFVLLDM